MKKNSRMYFSNIVANDSDKWIRYGGSESKSGF